MLSACAKTVNKLRIICVDHLIMCGLTGRAGTRYKSFTHSFRVNTVFKTTESNKISTRSLSNLTPVTTVLSPVSTGLITKVISYN